MSARLFTSLFAYCLFYHASGQLFTGGVADAKFSKSTQCATDPAMENGSARSIIICADHCLSHDDCVAFNFYKDERKCDLYDQLPVNYATVSGCVHGKLMEIHRPPQVTVSTPSASSTTILVLNNTAAPTDSFKRNWADYKIGFGNPNEGNYWIGNDKLHNLTATGEYELRIDIQLCDGNWRNVNYTTFIVENETAGYRLHISGYHGDLPDSLLENAGMCIDGMQFSTMDVDNDPSSGNCASTVGGGFWFNDCTDAALTRAASSTNPGFRPYWNGLDGPPMYMPCRDLLSAQMTLTLATQSVSP